MSIARFQTNARGVDLALQFTSIVRGRVDWLEVNTPAAVNRLNDETVTVDDFERRFRWNQVAAEFSRTTRGLHFYGEMASFKGETLSADKDNAFVEISRPLAGRVSASLVLGMLDRRAVGLSPWVYFDPRPNLRLAASLYGYLGVAESTYSNVGLGAFAEVKYTF